VVTRVTLALLVLAAAAHAEDAPDSSAVEETRIEDALEEDAPDPGLLSPNDGEPGVTADRRGVFVTHGQLRITPGAHALAVSFVLPKVALDARLARERGEPRMLDDRAFALVWRPGPLWRLAVGRVLPSAGRGLVLGSPRTTTARPSLGPGEPFGLAALPAVSPARAAGGVRGAWLAGALGAWRVAALASATRRDARESDGAWLPVASARHRNVDEEARRARIGERAFALALARGPAWLVVAHARTDPRRATPESSSQASEAAAAVVTGGPGLEFGFHATPRPKSRAQAAFALDAHGRTRFAGALETAQQSPRAALVFETEARGFTPLLARPDKRPHAHVGVLARGPMGARKVVLAFEAHAIERRDHDAPRLWAALRLERAGAWLELRRDAEPMRTLVAIQVSGGRRAHYSIGGTWRFDRTGLAREAWQARASANLRGRWILQGDVRLSGGRSAAAALDSEVPGGLVVRTTGGWGRLRLDLSRRGRVAPHVIWLRTQTVTGAFDEARFVLEWITGPP